MDAGFTMLKKMPKKIFPRVIMAFSCLVMFVVQMFALKFSSISLMFVAGVVGLIAFLIQRMKKGGCAE